MGVLQRFERRLGGLVEGAFAKVFKGDVQPVEIASALQRETDDRKTVVGQGKVLVPNEFVVELGDHDYKRLQPYEEPLGNELAAMVKEHAAEQGYSFVGAVTVTLELMADVDTGTFRIRSGVSAGDVADGGRLTVAGSAASDRAGAAPPAGALPGRPRLVVSTGGKASAGSPESRGEEQAVFLTHSVTVIGRANDADVTLYWNADENRTSVELFHAATEQMFRFSVERERALYAFEHPFAYLQTLPVDAVLVAESV